MTNPSPRRRARRVWAAIVCLAAVAGLLSACSTGSDPATTKTVVKTVAPSTPTTASTPASTTTPPATPSTPSLPKQVVKVTSLESDGATYGVGMPIVLYFSPLPTDSTAFINAVKVTVDGQAAGGAWYWEQPDADEVKNHVIEAHYRPQKYWKADSQVHVSIPIGGLSAGKTKTHQLVYSDKLTSLDFNIGDAHISTINATNKRMTVTSNGQVVKTLPVSLGAAQTPTYKGVKVVMQKGEDTPGTNKLRPNGAVRMVGPGYDEIVSWSVRITQSGEYIHAAPWNSEIGRASTSNGCTNLTTADAKWFYNFSQIGDVATYGDAPGPMMRPDDGLGDWNVPWPTWQAGGKLPTKA